MEWADTQSPGERSATFVNFRTANSVLSRAIGVGGPRVGALGLGCNGISLQQPRDDAESVATIMAALDAGITLLDTADFYGMGHNETLVGQAIRGRRDQAFLSVKCGALFAPGGKFLGVDGRPASIKTFAAYSLQRLGVDVIDLYQAGRADPAVPYEDTIGAIADLIAEGKVRYLGVSEVGADLLRRAHAVYPVAALEIEYSLACRFIEAEILPVAREIGATVVAYRVLADGLLSGGIAATGNPQTPPRLQGAALTANLAVVATLTDMAHAKGCSAAQLAVAWLLTRGDNVLPLVGMRRRSRLAENLAILDIVITAEELAMLDAVFAPGVITGGRYPEFVLKYAAR